jgi:hypothetical protein
MKKDAFLKRHKFKIIILVLIIAIGIGLYFMLRKPA